MGTLIKVSHFKFYNKKIKNRHNKNRNKKVRHLKTIFCVSKGVYYV